MNKGYLKELAYKYGKMVIKKEQNGIRINYMALPRLHMMMVPLIGGNKRMIGG